MEAKPQPRRWGLWTLVVLGWALLLAFASGRSPGCRSSPDTLFNLWIYHASIALGAAACFVRAGRSRELRGAWIAFGLGLTLWTLADIYWVVALEDLRRAPYPSLSDAGYLLALPCLFVGIAMLIKQRIGRFTLASWFDGAIAALGAAAAVTAVLAPTLIGLTKGDPATVFTNLAYPVGDVILLAFICAALVVGGRRRFDALVLIAAGLVVWTVADATYLYLTATGTYKQTNAEILDLLWPAGALLIGTSAAVSTSRPSRSRSEYRSSVLVP